MPAQESGEPEAPKETVISVQTGVYTAMLIAAAACMAAAVAFIYFSQQFYEVGAKGELVQPVHGDTGEAGLKSVSKSSSVEEEKTTTEEKKEETAPAAEEKKEEAKPAAEEKKEEAKPAEEKKKEE